MNNGLTKLSPYNGTKVFRGCGQGESEIAKTWNIGEEITFKDFKSTSINQSTASEFMNMGGGDVIYEISNPLGYNICNISCLPGQAEILFKSGAKFEVTNVIENVNFIDPANPLNVTLIKKKIFLILK